MENGKKKEANVLNITYSAVMLPIRFRIYTIGNDSKFHSALAQTQVLEY